MTTPSFRSKKTVLVLLLALPFLLLAIFSSYRITQQANARAELMHDYSEANSILYGMFSINQWRDHVREILSDQIDAFEFTADQDSLLRAEITAVLNRLVSTAEQKIQREDNGLKGKIRKLAVNTFVDWEKLRQQTPAFADAATEELTSRESKERLKAIAHQELEKITSQIYDDTLNDYLQEIYEYYGTENLNAFNEEIGVQTELMQQEVYDYTYVLLGIVGLFLLPWFFSSRYRWLRKPWFLASVALALVVLFTGLTSPMIEIDARIVDVNFVLLNKSILFDDQILFYRSKSILQVVWLLIQSSRVDSTAVGILILAFSVILPVAKMISAPLYLFSGLKTRRNKLLTWLAFKSGKWSMADVMVVAIFMSYVGFDGILDDQLSHFNIDSENYTSISTNNTSIRPGFIVFTAYVMFGLILSTILERITKKEVNIGA